MGRGRQKAKQTKVARRLKYSTPDTDISALEAELRGQSSHSTVEVKADEDDRYSQWYDDEDGD